MSTPVTTPHGQLHKTYTYIELIDQALNNCPDNIAFVAEDVKLTYRESRNLYGRLRATLRRLGLKKGDGVAILSSNRPESFLATSAVMAEGGFYTALHPRGGLDDHLHVLVDSRVQYLIYDPTSFGEDHIRQLATVETLKSILSLGQSSIAIDILEESFTETPSLEAPVPAMEDLAFLVYTGGTTGKPKGVMHPHRSMAAAMHSKLGALHFPDEVRFLAVAPITHATGLYIYPTLAHEGAVHMLKAFDASAYTRAIEEHRITMLFMVPSMLYMLLDAPSTRTADLSSVKAIAYAASPIAPSRLKEALDLFGPIFEQHYAQSEAPNTLTVLKRRHHQEPELLRSCGRPSPGVELKLLDQENREVDVGEVGEICVRGPMIMDGYWRLPELTAQTLREGWLHTGDLGQRDKNGMIYIVDRMKDMVISGGFNIYPKEVEDVISGIPGVESVSVIGVPDDKWGEAVTAVVVRRPDSQLTREQIIETVRSTKGSIFAPKRVEFVDSLPLTSVGKIDKKVIRNEFWTNQQRAVN